MSEEPVELRVEDGRLSATSGALADRLGEHLDAFGPDARHLAELGVGTNDRAVLGGNLLEDEKILGTLHVAFGASAGIGGTVNVRCTRTSWCSSRRSPSAHDRGRRGRVRPRLSGGAHSAVVTGTATGHHEGMSTAAAPTLPPGPDAAAMTQTLAFMRSPAEFLTNARERYGDVFTLRLAGTPPLVVVADPAAIRDVFTGPADVMLAGAANAPLGPVLGPRSLLLLDREEHLVERRRLLPPFHGERMKAYERIMERATQREIEGWPVGRPFALLPGLQDITLEVIMRAVLGVATGERYEQLAEGIRLMLAPVGRVRAAAQMLSAGDELPRRFSGQIADVDTLIHDELRDRRADPRLAERDDILSMLIGAGLSDDELRDEVMTLLLAGHETTATALAWTLRARAPPPEVLERLPEDQAYLDAVCKESLRNRPVVGSVGRLLAEPYTVGGYHLPAGTVVMPSIGLSHRREEAFPDHGAFRPERFLGDDAPSTYEWLPFGGGPRRCIGAAFALFEMRVVVRTILRGVRLRADGTGDEPVARRGIVMAPGRGARVVRLA
jgi:cytochrome P450